MSVKSAATRSSATSDLIDAESEVQTMLDTLNQRMAAIQLKKSRRTPVPIPFDDKDWVKEAKTWTTSQTVKPPDEIKIVVRMGSITQSFRIHPNKVKFWRVKVCSIA